MEANIEEALRAKENAQKLFTVKDFVGARSYALKAQTLCPKLDGIAHMVATFEIHAASEKKINGELDFYSVLGVDPSADKSVVKKQYRKMAVLLHPDKNKTVGADEAFKLVSEAWTMLSDSVKRSSYDARRNKLFTPVNLQSTSSSAYGSRAAGFDSSSNPTSSVNKLDTFWTVCTSCRVQYEYLRKYVNKRLSCKNCRGVFMAVETGAVPVTYCPWSNTTENGYGNNAFNVPSYVTNTSVCFTGNGSPSYHSGHGSRNLSFQWNFHGASSTGVLDPSGLTSNSANLVHQANNGYAGRAKANGKHHMRNPGMNIDSSGYVESTNKPGRPPKKRKIELADAARSGNGEMASRPEPDVVIINGNGNAKHIPKVSIASDTVFKQRCSAAPAFDARKLLIDKARSVILDKLVEMKTSAFSTERNGKSPPLTKFGDQSLDYAGSGVPGNQFMLKRTASMPITVPDPDFHDFDMDRSEECFKPKQIWALYDEEDGMPRLYCLIRQVISVKPFQMYISYLSSKTDTEFGSVRWIDSGFTKSCGSFRVFHSDIVDQVNIFSHLLGREKAGRGGCVRIYPKSGDIWAVYRNWSSGWNRKTPKEVRHQYEMVEVIDDYSEDLGVCVTPLIKLEGYKTVYQRNSNKSAIRWIPRREMLRFSHQVPSCMLKGEGLNLPEGCWDLDPAATPEELLQVENPSQV